MYKQVKKYSEVKEKILRGIAMISDPVRQTLGPKGGNVLFERDGGDMSVSNDGAAIARAVSSVDPIENGIIKTVKQGAFKTNTVAGDGTSTTILWSSILAVAGLQLVENGFNQMDVVHAYEDFANQVKARLQKRVLTIKTDADLFHIAKISSNNDDEIAANVVKTVKTAGEDGMVFLDVSNTEETEIIEDTGFNIETGMFTPELMNNQNGQATYTDVPVLVTDKRLYYQQEAETILNTCLKNGYKQVVIVAKDFIGEALPYFVANHKRGGIRVLLIKDPKADESKGLTLEDLAVYLGGEVVSDKVGSIVDNLQIENFIMARRVYADALKTIISRDKEEPNKPLDARIKTLKAEKKKLGSKEDAESVALNRRIASLTNGVVTVRIGGFTPVDVQEKVYRYEDAVSATRIAMKDGYLIGGGVSIWHAVRECKFTGDYAKVFRQIGEANIRQIAENGGLNGELVLDTMSQLVSKYKHERAGFNALTGTYGDLLEEGVIDPYKVTEMALENSVAIACSIVSSRYIIVNDFSDESKDNSFAKGGAKER